MPKGLTAAPDTSCVTSFSSSSMENSIELERKLSETVEQSTSARAGLRVGAGQFGGSANFGVAFSSNKDFQSTQSSLKSGESKVIFSTAHCNYYFTELNLFDLPSFSEELLQWVSLFNTSSDSVTAMESLAFQFFDYFGTHIPEQVLYGARYTYEYKFTKTQETSLTEQAKTEKDSNSFSADMSMSIGSLASASAGFSSSGSYGMSQSKKDQIKKFQETVETRTVSVGAPPPYNGDAMEWASTVKDTPVPVKFSLLPIYTLFDERVVKQQLHADLSKALYSALSNYAAKYCWTMQETGLGVQCQDQTVVKITPINTKAFKVVEGVTSEYDCLDECFKREGCFFANFNANKCKLFPSGNANNNITEYTIDSQSCVSERNTEITAYLILPKLDKPIHFKGLKIKSATTTRSYYDFPNVIGSQLTEQCNQACSLDSICEGFELIQEMHKSNSYNWNCRTFTTRTDPEHECNPISNYETHYVSDLSRRNTMKKLDNQDLESVGLFFSSKSTDESSSVLSTSAKESCFDMCRVRSDCVSAVFHKLTQCHLSDSVSLNSEDECGKRCSNSSIPEYVVRESNHGYPTAWCKCEDRSFKLASIYVSHKTGSHPWVNISDAGLVDVNCGVKLIGGYTESSCSKLCLDRPTCVASVFDVSCYMLSAKDFTRCLQYKVGAKVNIPNTTTKIRAHKLHRL